MQPTYEADNPYRIPLCCAKTQILNFQVVVAGSATPQTTAAGVLYRKETTAQKIKELAYVCSP